MLAPTRVVGPDGSSVDPGEEIPADWLAAMPDLPTHLDGLAPSSEPTNRAGVSEVVTASTTFTRERESE